MYSHDVNEESAPCPRQRAGPFGRQSDWGVFSMLYDDTINVNL